MFSFISDKLCDFVESRTCDFNKAAMIPFEGHTLSSKHRKIIQNAQDLDNNFISIKTFMQRVISMKFKTIEETLDYSPSLREANSWNSEIIDYTDEIFSENSTETFVSKSEIHVQKSCEKNDCFYCSEHKADSILDPCGHMVICTTCSELLEKLGPSKGVCPICSIKINKTIKIRMQI